MKAELFLDYQTVLANQAAPIHFACISPPGEDHRWPQVRRRQPWGYQG